MSEHGDDYMGEFGDEGMDWSETADLTVLDPEGLRELLGRLSEEERVVSRRRRFLQGRIDLIRSELVRRGLVSLSPEDLARVLIGREDNPRVGDEGPADAPGDVR